MQLYIIFLDHFSIQYISELNLRNVNRIVNVWRSMKIHGLVGSFIHTYIYMGGGSCAGIESSLNYSAYTNVMALVHSSSFSASIISVYIYASVKLQCWNLNTNTDVKNLFVFNYNFNLYRTDVHCNTWLLAMFQINIRLK